MVQHPTSLTLAMAVLTGAILMVPVSTYAEETLDVEAFNFRWEWNGQQSEGLNIPLIIEVAHGDELQFKGVGGFHGVETLDDKANDGGSEDDDFVAKCGENKPSAVLEERGCTNGSNYGKKFSAPPTKELMKLKVRENFSADVHFWCAQHTDAMWGTIKLKN